MTQREEIKAAKKGIYGGLLVAYLSLKNIEDSTLSLLHLQKTEDGYENISDFLGEIKGIKLRLEKIERTYPEVCKND